MNEEKIPEGAIPVNLPPKPKKTWKDVVAEANGMRIFVPENLMKEAKTIEEDREKLKEFSKKSAKLDIEFRIKQQNFFLAIRQHLAKDGRDDIWLKDIGYEAAALKDGEYVININEPSAQ